MSALSNHPAEEPKKPTQNPERASLSGEQFTHSSLNLKELDKEIAQREWEGSRDALVGLSKQYLNLVVAQLGETSREDRPLAGIDRLFEGIHAQLKDKSAHIDYLNQLGKLLNQRGERSPQALVELANSVPSSFVDSIDKDVQDFLGSSLPYFLRSFMHRQPDHEIDELGKRTEELSGLDRESFQEKRAGLIDEFEKILRKYDFRVVRYGSDESEPLHAEEAVKPYLSCKEILFDVGSGSIGTSGIPDQFSRALFVAQFKHDLENILPTVDPAQLDADRLQYGAKAAHLRALERIKQDGSEFFERYRDLNYEVPPFESVPATLYSKWANGENIDPDLTSLHQRWGTKDIIVRSSAVHSEDGSELTGAGVYESITLKANSTFEDFRDAVQRVYDSVESEGAEIYRSQSGIDQELMGLVIQQFVEPGYEEFDFEGYINSSVYGAPHLLEMVTSHAGTRLQIVRAKVPETLFEGAQRVHGLYHFERDYQSSTYYQADNLPAMTLVLEHAFDKKLQLEILEKGSEYHLFQARALPSSYAEAYQANFPENEQEVYSGKAIGFGDLELDVLEPYDPTNCEKEGVALCLSSTYSTMSDIYSVLPKKGAVILLYPSSGNRGHIETLCAERGILCVFPTPWSVPELQQRYPEVYDQIRRDDTPRVQMIDSLAGHSRLRIVANGTEGRVYPVETTSNKQEQEEGIPEELDRS